MSDAPRRVWEEGQDMAYQIIKRHPELFRHVPAFSDILFVLDTINEPTSKGNPVPARLSKIAGKVIDFIDTRLMTADQVADLFRASALEQCQRLLSTERGA